MVYTPKSWKLVNFVALLLTLVCSTPSTLLDDNISSDGVIYADTELLERVFSQPRDFTLSILLTANSDRVSCEFCKILGPGFSAFANSYNQQTKPEDRSLYFIEADVDRTLPIFKTLGLTHVPNLVFYKPTVNKADIKRGLNAEHTFTAFTSNADQLDHLSNVYREYGFHIKVTKPFNWNNFLKFVGTAASVLIAGFVFRNKVIQVWQSKQIWLALSLMGVVMFTAGHMFNVIRGTPFMGAQGQLVEGGIGNQFAVETQIVATLYGSLAFTVIGLIKFVSKLENVYSQTVASVGGSVVILVLYSILIETYKIKTGGYSYNLLPLKIF